MREIARVSVVWESHGEGERVIAPALALDVVGVVGDILQQRLVIFFPFLLVLAVAVENLRTEAVRNQPVPRASASLLLYASGRRPWL